VVHGKNSGFEIPEVILPEFRISKTIIPEAILPSFRENSLLFKNIPENWGVSTFPRFLDL